MKSLIKLLPVIIIILFFTGCGTQPEKAEEAEQKTETTPEDRQEGPADPMENEGVGPFTGVQLEGLDKIDEDMAQRGKEIFETKCGACHKMDSRYVGPKMKGVTERRNLNWVMNMMYNPEEMTKKDPIAQKMFREFNGTQMVYQDISKEDARAILEYFRKYDIEHKNQQK